MGRAFEYRKERKFKRGNMAAYLLNWEKKSPLQQKRVVPDPDMNPAYGC